MPRDIDTIIARVQAIAPTVVCERLRVKHPGADDDRLWYFKDDQGREVQLEALSNASEDGDLPFICESYQSDIREEITTVDAAVVAVFVHLGRDPATGS